MAIRQECSEPKLLMRANSGPPPSSASEHQRELKTRASDREVITPADVDLEDIWFRRVVGQVNDQLMKVAKLKGQNVWNKHDGEDEMFLLVSGILKMEYEDRTVELKVGDLHVVPRGVMHNPIAEEECRVVLIEPASTKHFGNATTEKAKNLEEQMS